MFQKDTIAAIATGMTNAGIGIIRVSGTEAIEIVDSMFRPKKRGKRIADIPSYYKIRKKSNNYEKDKDDYEMSL